MRWTSLVTSAVTSDCLACCVAGAAATRAAFRRGGPLTVEERCAGGVQYWLYSEKTCHKHAMSFLNYIKTLPERTAYQY